MDYAEEALQNHLAEATRQRDPLSTRGISTASRHRPSHYCVDPNGTTSPESVPEPGPSGGRHRGPPPGYPFESPMLADGGGQNRSCFICLEGPRRGRRGGPPKLLHPCCSQCYAVVHEKCWTAYRRRQRLAAFRARLLGHRTPDTSKCSICRTGRGGLSADLLSEGPAQPMGEGASALQEQLLATLGRLLMDDGEVPGQPICSGFCICLNVVVLMAVFIGGSLLVALAGFRVVTVFLLSLFAYYHFILFQLLYLAIRHRRAALASLPPPPTPPPDGDGPPRYGDSSSLGGSRVAPQEQGHSTSSRSVRASHALRGGSSDSFQITYDGRGDQPSEEQQHGGYGRWFSFLRRGQAAAAEALAATASAPFLPDAALVVEMQVLHSGAIPL